MTITELINQLVDKRAELGDVQVELDPGDGEDFRVVESVTHMNHMDDYNTVQIVLGGCIGG